MNKLIYPTTEGQPQLSTISEEYNDDAEGDNETLFESNWHDSVKKFDELGLSEDVYRGIVSYGFEDPSPIQQKAIIPILQGRDTIAQAQSGTGKTGAFAIATLQLIDPTSDTTQALICAHTRELALQISKVIEGIGEWTNITVRACYGGNNVREDIKHTKNGVHIVVGTPGRIKFLLKKGFLKTDQLKLLVIDEVDEMLSGSMKDQVRDIFKFLPAEIQIALFSATMPMNILKLSEDFMRDPARILIKKDSLTLRGIKQYYVPLEKEDWKLEVLMNLYMNLEINQAIIYCNTTKRVNWLAKELNDNDFTVSSMSGDMDQVSRDLVMREFRTGATRILISTDLLSRGIDVQQVSVVINYDLPNNKESYIHRIGRSGRYGRKGTAINFVTPREADFLKDLQGHYNTQIIELPSDLEEL